MFHSPFSPIVCISHACSTTLFANDTRGPKGWKVVLHKKPIGQRSQYTQEGNLKLTLFKLGNNFDHLGLKIINQSLSLATLIPFPNVDVMISELIITTQVVATKMVVVSNYDDEANEPKSLFIKLGMVIFIKIVNLLDPCLNFSEITCNNMHLHGFKLLVRTNM
jgi:hypothetical protein